MQILAESTYNYALYHNTNLYDRELCCMARTGGNNIGLITPGSPCRVVLDGPYSHREALRKVVERCLGQAYADRKGLSSEGPSFIKMPE